MAQETHTRPADRVIAARARLADRTRAPWDTCSCHDACPGDYGGPHCNADLGGDIDALIAATRGNASTATYLDVHSDRMARDVDGDSDRNDGADAHSANEHAHCCGDAADCAADCGSARPRDRA